MKRKRRNAQCSNVKPNSNDIPVRLNNKQWKKKLECHHRRTIESLLSFMKNEEITQTSQKPKLFHSSHRMKRSFCSPFISTGFCTLAVASDLFIAFLKNRPIKVMLNKSVDFSSVVCASSLSSWFFGDESNFAVVRLAFLQHFSYVGGISFELQYFTKKMEYVILKWVQHQRYATKISSNDCVAFFAILRSIHI